MSDYETIREALEELHPAAQLYADCNDKISRDYYHEYNKALEALDRLEKQGEWQPIETAPRKGRQAIYIWGPNYREPQKVYADSWWTCGFSVETKPTHWQPLPQPPQEETPRCTDTKELF